MIAAFVQPLFRCPLQQDQRYNLRRLLFRRIGGEKRGYFCNKHEGEILEYHGCLTNTNVWGYDLTFFGCNGGYSPTKGRTDCEKSELPISDSRSVSEHI